MKIFMFTITFYFTCYMVIKNHFEYMRDLGNFYYHNSINMIIIGVQHVIFEINQFSYGDKSCI